MLQHGVAERRIERRVLERQRVHVADIEAHVRDAALRRERARGVDGVGAHVDADRFGGSDRFCKSERDAAGAAADIEQAHPGFQVRQQKRRIARGRAPCVRGRMRGPQPALERLTGRLYVEILRFHVQSTPG